MPSEQEYLTLAGACGKGLFEHYVIFDTESKDNRFLSRKRLVQLGLLEQREYYKDLPSIYSESDQGSAKGDTESLTQRPVAGTPPSSKLVKRAALSTPRVGPVTRT